MRCACTLLNKSSLSTNRSISQFRILEEKLSNHGLSLRFRWGEEGWTLQAANSREQNVSKISDKVETCLLAPRTSAHEVESDLVDSRSGADACLCVLKPGGSLIVIAEHYKGGKNDLVQQPVMKFLRSAHLSLDDQRTLFSNAGYVEVRLVEEKSKGWFCGIGQKP